MVQTSSCLSQAPLALQTVWLHICCNGSPGPAVQLLSPRIFLTHLKQPLSVNVETMLAQQYCSSHWPIHQSGKKTHDDRRDIKMLMLGKYYKADTWQLAHSSLIPNSKALLQHSIRSRVQESVAIKKQLQPATLRAK